MTRPVTARDISDACDAKPLGRFGCKSVERVCIRPVTILPAASQGRLPGPGPAQPNPAGEGREQEDDAE